MEVLLGGIVKTAVFLIVPAVLGILPQTWAALLGSGLFRLPAGGAHCTAYHRCLISSLGIFSLIGLTVKEIVNFPLPTGVIFLLTLGAAALAVFLWGPADTEARPVAGASQRKKRRLWAYGVLLAYLFSWLVLDIPKEVVLAVSFGLAVQSITITPFGFKMMACLDKLMSAVFGLFLNERGVVSK